MKIEEEKRMNKFKKAAEHFSSYIGNDCYSDKMQNYCELAVEALEKQIPKKPTKTLDVRYGNDYEYFKEFLKECYSHRRKMYWG